MNLLSFKRIVTCFGLLTIASSPTIMVMSTVNSKEVQEGTKEVPKSDSNSKLVVRAINNTVYHFGVYACSSPSAIYGSVCANFIKNYLNEDIQRIFNNDLYSTNKIVNEHRVEISESDFWSPRTVYLQINYNYGEFKNQVTTLSIKIIS